jgi:FkbM family methyltransferase
MKLLKSLVTSLFRFLPPDDERLYRLCRHYVDRYNGENNDDIHTNGELRFMRQTLGNCHTVFDVGANVGEWAALALSLNPTVNLHCFEPSKPTYQRLAAKAFPSNVALNNFGLGSAREERTLHVFENGSGLNSIYKRQGLEDGWGLATQQRTEAIWLDTIDHYCRERSIKSIDFLKVDVEGHELEVLRGASGTLVQGQIKTIQFEYGGCNIDSRVLLKDIFEFFRPFAYNFYKIYPHELRKIQRYDQRLENFQYQNWVVMRAE